MIDFYRKGRKGLISHWGICRGCVEKLTFELNIQWLSFWEQKEHMGTEHVASICICYKDGPMGSLEESLQHRIQRSTELILRKSSIILEGGLTHYRRGDFLWNPYAESLLLSLYLTLRAHQICFVILPIYREGNHPFSVEQWEFWPPQAQWRLLPLYLGA